MATITELVMWKDTGYTDGATEIPPIGHTLRQPDLTIEGALHPSKDRLFSELQIQVDYTAVLNMSYLRFTLDMDNGEDITIYGWIDDVKVQSDTSDHPLTIITWHVDPWRTFGARARYGSGRVVRRPSTPTDLYQNYPYRHKVVKSDFDDNLLFNNTESDGSGVTAKWWVLIAYQREKNEGEVVELSFITTPLGSDYDRRGFIIGDYPGGRTGGAPSFKEVFFARIDELLGLNPKSITGAWLCPVCPMGFDNTVGTGTAADPLIPRGLGLWQDLIVETPLSETTSVITGALETIGVQVEWTTRPELLYHWERSLSGSRVSTEGHEYVITAPGGEVIGTVPFGKSIPSVIKFDLVASSINAFIRIDMGPASEGMVFYYPLPTIDINSNSWSDYVYSGQRDYEIRQRNLNSTSQLVEGAVTGAATGILLGGLGKPLTRVTGNYVGGALTAKRMVNNDALKNMAGYAALGSSGSLIGGALDLAYFNDEYQKIEDSVHAKQADSCLMTGTPWYLYQTDGFIRLQYLEYDEPSKNAIDDIRTVQGVRYDMPLPDCTALINAGGPLQIRNLIVGGEIPAAVKRWIKEKFASGVRIIAR